MTLTEPQPIGYEPSSALRDNHRYKVREWYYASDPVLNVAQLADLPALAASPNWEDRVRAEVLRQRSKLTLPDQFPVLYETPDSPNQAGHTHKRPKPWVISPDIEMLEALLERYQELWDAYTSQWGPQSRRLFTVGRLDGMTPHGVYRPGSTPEQVLGQTMLTHDGMYARAPKRLKELHPLHASWMTARMARSR